MDFIIALILGAIQGITEFLPVSSSGHLVLAQHYLSVEKQGMAFEVFTHLGTLVAIFIAFRKEVLELVFNIPKLPFFILGKIDKDSKDATLSNFNCCILVSMIPAGFAGFVLKSKIDELYNGPNKVFVVYIALLITGILLMSLVKLNNREEKNADLAYKKSFLIGLAQAFAITPGISRSGSTIVAGQWLGLNRELAAKFSFIMSMPVIFGASLKEAKDLAEIGIAKNEIISILGATFAAIITGYFCIKFLMKIIKAQKLQVFAYYCFALSFCGLSYELFIK